MDVRKADQTVCHLAVQKVGLWAVLWDVQKADHLDVLKADQTVCHLAVLKVDHLDVMKVGHLAVLKVDHWDVSKVGLWAVLWAVLKADHLAVL